MDRQKKAYLYGLLSVLFWSTVASAFKLSLRHLTPVELLLYASLFSCMILAIALGVQGKWYLIRQAGRKEWQAGLVLGLLNPFLYYLVLFKAYDLLPAQQAQPLNYTWAITLSLLAVPLLGHRMSRRDLLAVLISYFGVYVISTRGALFSLSFENPFGVALALGSTVLWSVYWLLNTKDTRDPVVGLFLNFTCALPFIAGYLLITEGFRIVSFAGICGAFYVGCFEMGISFIFWLMALKYTRSAAKVAQLIFISPFLSLILIHFIVGEEILGSSIIGLLFIMAGLVLQSIGGKKLLS